MEGLVGDSNTHKIGLGFCKNTSLPAIKGNFSPGFHFIGICYLGFLFKTKFYG
jgi:hypothetical protein